MNAVLIFVLILVPQVFPKTTPNNPENWEDFKVKYNRNYKPHEEIRRKQIFLDNVAFIRAHNEKFKKGQVTYGMSVNHFTDLTFSEFQARTGASRMPDPEPQQPRTNVRSARSPPTSTIPDQIDWRIRGAVTSVKHQGEECGSCWAFAAVGSLEGQYFLKTGRLVPFSVQELVDCDHTKGKNNGCKKGVAAYALQYVANKRGISTEESYPYTAKEGTCRTDGNKVKFTVGITYMHRGDEERLKRAVANVGPVAVLVVSTRGLEFYDGRGVFYDSACNERISESTMYHYMLVVGYGTSPQGQDYWLLKNSWSTGWGSWGYLYLARNRNNHCKVASGPVHPTVTPL